MLTGSVLTHAPVLTGEACRRSLCGSLVCGHGEVNWMRAGRRSGRRRHRGLLRPQAYRVGNALLRYPFFLLAMDRTTAVHRRAPARARPGCGDCTQFERLAQFGYPADYVIGWFCSLAIREW